MAIQPLLDAVLIRRRRNELGLSIRTIAEIIGVTGTSYTKLEGGFGHAELPLVLLVRLAEVLGLTLDQLTAGGGEPAGQRGAGGSSAAEDVAALGAVLFATRAPTPVGTLCAVTGWSLERLHAAEAALAEALAVVGIALYRQNARLGLARGADVVEDDVLQRALRAHLGRDHLSLTEARLLTLVEHGDVPTQPSNPERVALGMLTNAGLIVAAPSGTKGEAPLVLTDDVRFSLLLDEDPEPTAGPRRRRRSPVTSPPVPTKARKGRKENHQP